METSIIIGIVNVWIPVTPLGRSAWTMQKVKSGTCPELSHGMIFCMENMRSMNHHEPPIRFGKTDGHPEESTLARFS